MNDIRYQIIDAARSWLGTPFLHQGRLKGLGVDCIGLILGVDETINGGMNYPDPKDYPRDPIGTMMADRLKTFMRPVPLAIAQPGDVIHFAWGRFPQHVSILTDEGTMVHSDIKAGGVVEVTYGGAWPRRARGAYEFPRLSQ